MPAEAAGHLAGLPPASTLFATFLGANPIGHLLGPSGVLSTLPAHNAQTVTGTRFFPELIAGPCHHGLVIVFGAAAVMALVAAHASALRGRRSGTATDPPTGSAKDSTKEQARPAPAAGRPFNPPSARPPVERIAAAVAERAGAGRVLVTLEGRAGPGRAGAGKSTLAAAVAAYLGGPGHAVVVHGDDFFHPMPHHERLSMEPEEGYHRLFEWQRLRDQVLVPLSDGRPARYEQFDRDTNALRAGEPRSVLPAGVVIVEGVLTARPELAGFYDLIVFVDTPSELCLRRVYARPDRRPHREAWLTRWRAVEEYYLTATDMPARADLTVPGD